MGWGRGEERRWDFRQRMMNARGTRSCQSECSISKMGERHSSGFLSTEAKWGGKKKKAKLYFMMPWGTLIIDLFIDLCLFEI